MALASPSSSSDWKNNIKNVVVLVQENRSFDTFAGGLDYDKDINGLLHTKYCNPANVSEPHSKKVCSDKLTFAHDVAQDDPNHSMSGINLQLFSDANPDEKLIKSGKLNATMQGFITEQELAYGTNNLTRASEVINYYSTKHIPVFSAMAENFVLFDRWFCDVSGPTNPNRAYITSGTSNGHGSNDKSFNYGGYLTPDDKGVSGFNPDAMFYKWTVDSGVAEKNVKPFKQFLTDAKDGNLPAFSYINPECCSFDSFHPPSPIDLDHVPPPVNVPAGDDKTYTEKGHVFDFTRLGVRVPTVLMSPWLEKGVIEHKGTNNGGEYTHSSVLGFLAKLWDLDNLTPRTAWASTFEHLFDGKYRDDTPEKLPEPVVFG
ncbi:phosphoesterase family-domain-containing protein [Absidia repens]|uniref:Phosphoesterase family-domain-containing protein n=1 Tax=Absidia repens TaxID=90262 RepID=A0A1X2II29_9FUNG|nr:phosphoesterase family-domain-containing protein [Absidia repens]